MKRECCGLWGMRALVCAGTLAAMTLSSRAQPGVPQNGPEARAAQAIVPSLHLPAGFVADVYAVVPGARQLAVAPDGGVVFVGTQTGDVWRVDHRGASVAVTRFAPGLQFDMPNGVCWTPDGALVVAEFNRVRRFAAAATSAPTDAPPATDLVPQGKLVPAVVDSKGHGARVCRVAADGQLYIAIGQPHNIPPKERLAVYAQWGVGGIVRMRAADGGGREVYARGIRNSVGLDINPRDGSLWFTDNQTDNMGDDTPPGEINRATAAGQDFGYPYVGGRSVRIPGYADGPLPPGLVPPQVEMPAHAADLGIAFYTGDRFPARYRGGIFSAQHGSWNRSVPIGARVMFTALKSDGSAGATEVFADGWLDAASGEYRGRPVDVATLHDGSLLISDDRAGVIYRVRYMAAATP